MAEPAIWVIGRNCSAGPRQLAGVFVSVVAVLFACGVAFATQGLWMVLPFVGLEVLAVAAAFICYGRDAADYERIDLQGGSMRTELASKGQRVALGRKLMGALGALAQHGA